MVEGDGTADGAEATEPEGASPGSQVSVELVTRYLDLTARARAKATPLTEVGSDAAAKLADMLRMVDDYSADARHFMESGDLVRAFGAINYAHAWLDAAVRIGFLDGHGDDQLFTLPR